MVLFSRFAFMVFAAFCSALLCGCFPTGQRDQDEEKEPHFLAGRSRVNQMDYKGAIESFSKALEVNPRSARAHFELGWLYEEKDPDPAAAIYHYEQYLKLRPDAENAGTVRQRILGAKQELAKTVLPMPSTPGIQRELEQLAEQNRQLREELEAWRKQYGSRGSNIVAGSAPTTAATRPPQNPGTPTATPRNDSQQTSVPPARANAPRTHKVQAGESPSSIARKYGVKLEALMAANPGLNPKRLQVGQTLNVPPP
jgi:LysM repeat protein